MVVLKPGQGSHLIEVSKEPASKQFQIQLLCGEEEMLRA